MAREVDVGKGSEVVEGEVVDRFEGECRSLSELPVSFCVSRAWKAAEWRGKADECSLSPAASGVIRFYLEYPTLGLICVPKKYPR